MKQVIGKIESATFGFGGYDDRGFGLIFTFVTDDGRYSTTDKFLDYSSDIEFVLDPVNIADLARGLMRDAKVTNFCNLVGCPVELTLNDNDTFVSFRILTEAA